MGAFSNSRLDAPIYSNFVLRVRELLPSSSRVARRWRHEIRRSEPPRPGSRAVGDGVIGRGQANFVAAILGLRLAQHGASCWLLYDASCWRIRPSPTRRRAASMEDGLPTIFAFEEPQQLLSPWVVTCFTINVIMGSGFLGVPHGFREAGIVLGPLVLLGVTVLQWTAACQLAQVITRANALLADADAAATLTPTLAPLAKSEAESAAKLRPSPPSLNVPSHTSYEMLMLCRLHLGAWAERLVMLSAALYMVGTLCARLRDEPPPPPHLRPASPASCEARP